MVLVLVHYNSPGLTELSSVMLLTIHFYSLLLLELEEEKMTMSS